MNVAMVATTFSAELGTGKTHATLDSWGGQGVGIRMAERSHQVVVYYAFHSRV